MTFKFPDLLEQYVILQKKQSTGKKKNEDGYEDGEGGSDEEEEEEEALVCRVYFWQGRDASKVCWPQYSLRLVSNQSNLLSKFKPFLSVLRSVKLLVSNISCKFQEFFSIVFQMASTTVVIIKIIFKI